MQPSQNSNKSQKPNVVFSTSNNFNQVPTQIPVQQPPQINTYQNQFQQNYYQVPQQQQMPYNMNYIS
jgi:hypothetical protein